MGASDYVAPTPKAAKAPQAVAPGASARGLSFWRWCSLRSETAWFRAHSRLWRLVVRARPLARIAPSQARDATPAALPRSHRRRLLPPLPPAPPLRPRPPRRTQPLDPRGRAPPVFYEENGPAKQSGSGQTATGVPGLLRGAGRAERFAVPRTSMNGLIVSLRAQLIAAGGVGLVVVRLGEVATNSEGLALPDGVELPCFGLHPCRWTDPLPRAWTFSVACPHGRTGSFSTERLALSGGTSGRAPCGAV